MKCNRSLDLVDRWGNSVLRIALRHNRDAIAKILREHGAQLRPMETKLENDNTIDEITEKVEYARCIFDSLDEMKKGEIPLHILEKCLAKHGLFVDNFPVLQDEIANLLDENNNIKRFEKIFHKFIPN